MKKILFFLSVAAALTVSCAREAESDESMFEAESLAAYMRKYHPDAVRTSLGVYIFPDSEVPGTGAEIADESYIRVHYTLTDRDGRFRSSTVDTVNISNGNYSSCNYYGPVVLYRGDDYLSAGIEEMLSGAGTAFGPMKTGGTRKALIPGWLNGTKRYGSEEEYIKNVSGTVSVYEMSLVETFDDVVVWEKDSLARYIEANYPEAEEDTLIGKISTAGYEKYEGGWYYVSTRPGVDTTLLSSSSVIYCNYILRDLSGRVIDSNIEKVARDNDFYNSSSTYKACLINWDSDYTKITMTTSETDVVDGFANAFLHMHQYEAGTVFFWSYLGYFAQGSGSRVPAYCPLRFDIELVSNPDDV